ncbi:inverted formin-2-like, partial [Centroberyx affinis]|uniref:inverted formin-2-like n=1 Tax=Centroberyx affinis TaxID=166261 RepID=UPI003A5BF29F
LRESTRLPSFCKLILDVGNFLNYGSHTGNAEGFKISTLLKLTETKANKSRITLLHHIVEEVEQHHPDLLNLPDDLEICEKAAGVNLESIQSEANSLIKRLKNSEKKVAASSAEDLKEQYLSAIQDSLGACGTLEELLSSIQDRKEQLAVYLCEESSSFNLQELFSTVRTFRGAFLKAIKDNQTRREQAVRAEKRRKQQEEEESKRQKGENGKIIRRSVAVQEEGCIIDNLLSEIRKGFNLRKTKLHGDRRRDSSLPPADRSRDSSQLDQHGKLERSLAVEQPQTVSSQQEQPAEPAEPPKPAEPAELPKPAEAPVAGDAPALPTETSPKSGSAETVS